MSSVIDNHDTNKQWVVVTVLSYYNKNVRTNEVKDFVSNTKYFYKRSKRFNAHIRLSTRKFVTFVGIILKRKNLIQNWNHFIFGQNVKSHKKTKNPVNQL